MKNLREDIIARYRDRIAAGERAKLSDHEQHQLIESFVDRLRKLKTQAEIRSLCEAEIALLEEGYPKATIGKDRLRRYRTAIKAAMAEGKLPMTNATSRRYPYTKRNGETGEAHDHRALDFLKYDQATYSAIAGQSAERNNEKQDNLKPVNPNLYLAKAAELLQSDDPFELAVGIAATTGRRFSEVVDKGTLQPTDQPYWVSFAGQLKKKSATDSYFTPCLVLADHVLTALERFRSHPRIARVAGESTRELNRSLANSVKRTVHRHFGETGIIPVLAGEAAITIHNLRGVYGEICVHFFCPPTRGVARFVQERLGHVISDEELKRSNASATQHYFHYYLVDGNGKHIGSRGVKLTGDDPLPTLLKPERQHQTKPLSESQLPSESQPIESPELTTVINKAVPQEIATLSQQIETLTQEIQRIWSHVSSMNLQTPQSSTAIDTTFFTREIESLRSQIATIQQERDQASTQLEQVRTENEGLQQQFTQERQAYQQRIEGLTNLLKQTPPTAQSSPSPPLLPPPSQLVETPVAPVHSAVAAKLLSQSTTPEPEQSRPKREHITRAGSADQRVKAAMLAIQEWNRQHDSDSDKFAITQSLLQKTTGSNMPAVKRVMADFQNQIYEHNSQYGLDPDRHNYGKDFGEIKAWIQARL
jgi:FtsZ-binding cell division protein ZapB